MGHRIVAPVVDKLQGRYYRVAPERAAEDAELYGVVVGDVERCITVIVVLAVDSVIVVIVRYVRNWCPLGLGRGLVS